MQAQIATPIGVQTTYDATDGTTVVTAGSGGTFWNSPFGYAGVGTGVGGVSTARGTAYGSGSSVFTQTSTKATA